MEWLIELANERPVLLARYIVYAIAAISAVVSIALKKKKKTQKANAAVNFEIPEETTWFTLGNQNGRAAVLAEEDIRTYFKVFLDDKEQFILLNAPKPINDICFVQACHTNGKIELEIAVVQNGKNNLFYKYCKKKELLEILISFYHGQFAPDKSQYKPVEF